MNSIYKKRIAGYPEALDSLYPGSVWILRGDDLSGLEWMDESKPAPTHEILWPEVERLQQQYDLEEYKILRKTEYPPLQDFADAMYWHRKGDDTKLDAYVAACDAVKARYPKGL